MDNKKIIPIIIIILILLVGGLGFWYWSQKRAGAPEAPAAKVKDGLGAEAFKKTNNPLSNELPETNPFHINTNPFK